MSKKSSIFALSFKNNMKSTALWHHGQASNIMNIYELIRCEIDENNFIKNEKRVAFFNSIENAYKYLTKDGKSTDKISVIGHIDNSAEYIMIYMSSSDEIIKVHTPSYENPLIGYISSEYDTYYIVRTYEVRDYGFFKQ